MRAGDSHCLDGMDVRMEKLSEGEHLKGEKKPLQMLGRGRIA